VELRSVSLVFALGALGCEGQFALLACGPDVAIAERAIDGDTIVLDGGERVRYLLMDTPETGECFGTEAALFNRDLVEAREVGLYYDDPCRDRYGRLLAYVEVEGVNVNRLLVELGYARVLYIPPAGSDRVDEFRALEQQAKRERRGIWAACSLSR
jgi:micrococcal nuclease